jgi:hypothetical protein
MEYPDTSQGDVAYWQLTRAQASHHHARLSAMHARQARRFADKANAGARQAEIGSYISCALLAIVIVIKVAQGVFA